MNLSERKWLKRCLNYYKKMQHFLRFLKKIWSISGKWMRVWFGFFVFKSNFDILMSFILNGICMDWERKCVCMCILNDEHILVFQCISCNTSSKLTRSKWFLVQFVTISLYPLNDKYGSIDSEIYLKIQKKRIPIS